MAAVAAGVTFAAVAGALAATTSLWADEGDTWTTSATSTPYFFDAITDWDSHAPLYFTFMRLVSAAADSPLALRLPSIVAGVVTIALAGRLGQRVAGSIGARGSVALAASSALLLYHASEARNYAITMALVAASTLLLISAAEVATTRRWLVYGGVASALALTHTLALTVIGAHLVWMAIEWQRTKRRPSGGQIAAVGLVTIAAGIVLVLLLRITDSRTEFDPVGLKTPVILVRDLLGNGSWLPLVPVGLLVGAGIVHLLRTLPARRAAERPDAATLVLLAALVPPATLLLGSLVAPSSLVGARYSSVALPAVVVVASTGLVALRRLAVPLAVIAVASGLVAQGQTIADRDREDFEAAMDAVRSEENEPAAVAYFDAYSAWTGAYYLHGVAEAERPAPLLPDRYFPAPLDIGAPVISPDEVRRAATEGPALLWVVVRRREADAHPEDFDSFTAAIEDAGYEAEGTDHHPGIDVIRFER